jgi:AAA domain
VAPKTGFTPKKDYLEVARTKIVRANDIKKYPKILIYSRKKVGKTTLALTAAEPDKMLVIDPEEGANYKTKTNPYIWPIERWSDMDDVYGALRTGKLTPNHLKQGESSTPFQWAIPDGMTRINNFALHHVRHEQEERNLDRIPGFIDRRDYGKSGELMKQMMANFETLKMGVVYTAHERMKTSANFEEDEDDEGTEVFYVPDLPDAVRNHVNALVDVIGRLYIVRLDDPKNEGKKVAYRRLHIGPSDAYDTGYRSEYKLPDVLKSPSIPKLLKLMKDGV